MTPVDMLKGNNAVHTNTRRGLETFPQTLAFLDVETTGLYPARGGKVCEIAILRLDRNGLHEWQTLINPGTPMPPEVSAIHGITDDMVSAAPRFGSVAETIVSLIEDAMVVCHNAPFDLGFLAAECAQCQMTLPRRPVIDTLVIARRHFSFPSNALCNIARHLHIPVPTAHRALADVRTTYLIFSHFCSVVDSIHFLPPRVDE